VSDAATNPVARLRGLDRPHQYRRALQRGVVSEPGEALTPNDRRRLIHTLWTFGWTDQQIADWTGWTLYTTARLRDSLELRQHARHQEVA
jgi:hypothetical protein